MRVPFIAAALLFALGSGPGTGRHAPAAARQTQVVDRIVARVEDDVITLSEMEELRSYQQLVDSHSDTDARLLDELIDQWTINNDAETAQFAPPAEADVNAAIAEIKGRFTPRPPFEQRLAAAGLTEEALRRIVTRQIYLTRYVDYRFRPAVQVNDDDISKYYDDMLVPSLKAKQAAIPTLDAVHDQIRELLVVQAIDQRSAAWLQDTRARLKIEIEPGVPAPEQTKPAAPDPPANSPADHKP